MSNESLWGHGPRLALVNYQSAFGFKKLFGHSQGIEQLKVLGGHLSVGRGVVTYCLFYMVSVRCQNHIGGIMNFSVISLVRIFIVIFLSQGLAAQASIDTWTRDNLAWNDVQLSDTISDVGLGWMYAYPIILTINEDEPGSRLLTLASAHAVSIGVTKTVKVLAGRERPDGSDNRSFFSGHTSAAFTSAGYICRYEKDHCLPAVLLAGSVGYLRIGARKHWLSDVLVGAAVGYMSGHAMPIYTSGF